VGGRFVAVHATHLADQDFGVLGGGGSVCCLCPTTERDLADGVGPAARLREAGIGLALGSDSHAVVDLFEEARAVELDQRLATGERGRNPAPELLRAATATGHACLGWPEAGRLEPGAVADLVTIGLDSPRLAGTDPASAVASLVFAGAAADVRHVVVGGREVVRDGHHLGVDVPVELAQAIDAVTR
jgi:cytosine/adenosine deaminase-related metal-dependent hydrolase